MWSDGHKEIRGVSWSPVEKTGEGCWGKKFFSVEYTRKGFITADARKRVREPEKEKKDLLPLATHRGGGPLTPTTGNKPWIRGEKRAYLRLSIKKPMGLAKRSINPKEAGMLMLSGDGKGR